MPFRVDKFSEEDEISRHSGPERSYIAGLRDRGLIIELDNVLVDADQLVLRTFQCNTNYCVKCSKKEGAENYKGSCCTDLQVDVTPTEVQRLTELAQLSRERLEFAPGDPVADVVARMLGEGVAEENEEHELILRHQEHGPCTMGFMDENGQLRCAINTLVGRLDASLTYFKPAPCFHFPLHYYEFEKGKYLVSMLTEETRGWTRQHKSVTGLRCLKKPEPGSPPAYAALKWEITFLFGEEFYRQLEEAARPILERHLANAAAAVPN